MITTSTNCILSASPFARSLVTRKRKERVVSGAHARIVRFTEIGSKLMLVLFPAMLHAKATERSPILIQPSRVVTIVGFHCQRVNREASSHTSKIAKLTHCWTTVIKDAAGTPFKVILLSKGTSVIIVFMYMFMKV